MPNSVAEYYDEMLDEMGAVSVGTLEFMPSDILKNCDPIAYRVGLADFEDYLLENAEEEE
jgi:hypothetical protein